MPFALLTKKFWKLLSKIIRAFPVNLENFIFICFYIKKFCKGVQGKKLLLKVFPLHKVLKN